jgi:hypothetical protein
MQSSQRAFELRAGKYLCSRCGLTTDKCKVRQACATPCTHQPPLPSASDQIVPVQGTITISGRELHASHKLHFMQKYRLYFCRGRGKTATEDPRHLAAPCTGITKKGRENLAKIDKGEFTRAHAGRDGLTKFLRAATHGMAVEEISAAAAPAAACAAHCQG